MDVVEVSPNASPPVCRVMDFGKFIFEKKKKSQGAKKKQKIIHVKEIKNKKISVRNLKGDDLGDMDCDDFIKKLSKENLYKSN